MAVRPEPQPDDGISPYVGFSRDEWARLRAQTPLTLNEDDIDQLRGINDRLSLEEVADTYLPLTRLLNLYVGATQELHGVSQTFLGSRHAKVPFVIGIAGSVAVGKSTSARVLQALLSRWPNHPRVDLVTTDGFLYPNRVLQSRGIMHRKGFPESYDLRALVRFVADVKSGAKQVRAPVYSHLKYDIVPDEELVIRRPDVLILEGLSILQTGTSRGHVFVSDYIDFSIYVDAAERDIRRWYVERFLTFRTTAFADPRSHFHRYASLTIPQARREAGRIWREINGPNLRENVEPTRTRASLILAKGADHSIHGVKLRKL